MRRQLGFMGSILLVLSACLTIAGCRSDEPDKAEQRRILQQVRTFETVEYGLFSFRIDYDQYKDRLKGVAGEAYFKEVSDRVIFGYDGSKYTSKELAGMSKDEYEQHMKHMLVLMKEVGLDQQTTTVRFSGVFAGGQPERVYVYSSQLKEVKEKPFTKINKRYTLKRSEGKWIIVHVDEDKFTFGSEDSESDTASQLKKMKYGTHEGRTLSYPGKALILEGAGGE